MSEQRISLDRVISNAWKSMVRILFKPFSLERWLILGFCCWMVTLTDDVNTATNFIKQPVQQQINPSQIESIVDSVNWEAADYALNSSDGTLFQRISSQFEIDLAPFQAMIEFGAYVVFFLIILGAIFFWLRCRFEFIFLDNLVHDRSEIRKPWQEFRKIGNSYFFGYLLVTVAVVAIHLALLGGISFSCYSWLSESAVARQWLDFGETRQLIVTLCASLWVAFAIISGFYLNYFFFLLVPIMHRERVGFAEGFRLLNTIIRQHLWRCIGFWMMIWVIMFAAGLAFVLFGLLTCCLFWILLTIPYIRAVLLLPFWAFLRLCGVELLQALDPVELPPVAEE